MRSVVDPVITGQSSLGDSALGVSLGFFCGGLAACFYKLTPLSMFWRAVTRIEESESSELFATMCRTLASAVASRGCGSVSNNKHVDACLHYEEVLFVPLEKSKTRRWDACNGA